MSIDLLLADIEHIEILRKKLDATAPEAPHWYGLIDAGHFRKCVIVSTTFSDVVLKCPPTKDYFIMQETKDGLIPFLSHRNERWEKVCEYQSKKEL